MRCVCSSPDRRQIGHFTSAAESAIRLAVSLVVSCALDPVLNGAVAFARFPRAVVALGREAEDFPLAVDAHLWVLHLAM